MKVVKVLRFEKGDFIKGKKNNGYNITGEGMTRGVVTGVDERNDSMTIKVLEHDLGLAEGEECRVINSSDYFELLPKVNNKAKADHIVSAVAEKGSNLVTAVVKYKGEFYTGQAVCAPEDEFDFHMGAAIAIGRAFDNVEEVRGKRL